MKRPKCNTKGCRRVADHLLLPQHIDLCLQHYREARPYRLDVAAFATFSPMMSRAERLKWRAILDENEQSDAE